MFLVVWAAYAVWDGGITQCVFHTKDVTICDILSIKSGDICHIQKTVLATAKNTAYYIDDSAFLDNNINCHMNFIKSSLDFALGPAARVFFLKKTRTGTQESRCFPAQKSINL